ncbi:alpha/beta hydrolase [Nonomuraea turkmeniaca]|uniref:Alpha/beta hydrolase n=1 Tax=Nonomuraea turkmeniaca TaxID=103838 RepID=A0A5S4FWS5_9ACTN|nr:alpha/beta hydrolase [Nonomuraea turkmeniaca]TMR25287.1 alpha/beta hydrolase [Nonomuraea turkmeniaca]
MPFDPYLADKLALVRGLSREDLATDPAAQQKMTDYLRDPAEWTLPPDVVVEDLLIAGPHGDIPIRTYRPRDTSATVALLWAHGGGFSGGDLEMPEAHVVSAELAARAGAFVASVGYRLARNGVRYPVPLDDVDAAWHWLTAEAVPGRRAALGGASAGAALALATALRARDRARDRAHDRARDRAMDRDRDRARDRAQDRGGDGDRDRGAVDLLLLAYPFTHYPNPALDDATTAEMAALPPFMRFPTAAIEGMVRNYVGRISDLPPDALPGAARLDGLPATHILLSEYDDLRASGELLQRQLCEAGVTVSTFLARGMPHGHLNRTPSLREVDASLDYFATALGTL